jgi:protein gp37
VKADCDNCLAMHLAGTQQAAHNVALYKGTTRQTRDGRHVWNGNLPIREPGHPDWMFPLTYAGAEHPVMGPGMPSIIFTVMMGDLFVTHRPVEHIHRVIAPLVASRHIGLIQTRYTERLASYFAATPARDLRRYQKRLGLGFSAAEQRFVDERLPDMLPLAKAGWTVYLIVSPFRGPVVLPNEFLELDTVWCIASGEEFRGKAPRPMDPDWARALRDQCADAGVPFFFNQMSGRASIPADLFVREFPEHWRICE